MKSAVTECENAKGYEIQSERDEQVNIYWMIVKNDSMRRFTAGTFSNEMMNRWNFCEGVNHAQKE